MSLLSNPSFINLFLVVALIAVSFVVGGYLARALRMPDYGWKISAILLAALASAVIVYRGWPPKLGVDLGGGAILVYQVDTEKIASANFDMQKLISSISERVNPGGQKEITVRPLGSDKVQITMPQLGAGKDEKERQAESAQIKRIISQTGSMEFRIVANRKDHASLIERALSEPKVRELKDSAGETLAKWVSVRKEEAGGIMSDRELATRKRGDALEVLVVMDPYNITGDYLKQATSGADQTGRPCVNFTFNSTGGQLFGRLTTDNQPLEGFKRRLAIVLDDDLQSAPSINSPIFDRGEISGSFTRHEVDELVRILNAGSLPAALKKEPVRDMVTGPTLGGDTIHKSALAMILSSILVPLFMLWYYRFSGLVANLALALNMLMLVAVMILVKAPFTLPALAGLALTVGMAVDNNVLIYERLREELHHGAALRMAIRNAFHRAGVVIIDANCTHLIAATVLFVEGTEQVRGFAVTFWLGAVLSIWATMFVARVIFEIAERKRWLTQAKMLHIIGHTEIDFMSWFPAAATFSVLITVMGLAIAVHRGKGLFDIDFTGGVSVQTLFTEPQDVGDLRKKVNDLEDVAVSNVRIQDEPENQRFIIDTSNANLEEVKQDLKEKFGDKLISNAVSYSDVEVIKKPEAEAKSAAKPEAKPQAKPESKPEAKPEKQSRSDLPPDTMWAMAGPGPVFGLVDPPQPAPPAAKEKPAAEKPADAKPPAEKPAGVKPAAEKPAEEDVAAAAPSAIVGGTQAELKFKFRIDHKAADDIVKEALKAEKISLPDHEVELTNADYYDRDTTAYDHWTLRIQLPPEKTKAVLAAIQRQVKAMPYFPDVDAIGSAVAQDTQHYAIIALVSSWVLIILYLWIRFQGVAFGLAAVIALIHDVLVMLGGIAFSYYVPAWLGAVTLIEPFKINLPIVAAFMTIIGYSVNDTIVVFDRIREIRGKAPSITRQMVNDATNQTLSRTLLTSFTVLLVVVILYLAGGQAVHGFAFSLIVGVMTGTYSSIYVAAPILLWLVHPKEMKQSAEKTRAVEGR